MRASILIASLVLGLALSACGKDKDKAPEPGASSALQRPPGELPRPPSEGLPDDLKPPKD
jgi:hypothetical protein